MKKQHYLVFIFIVAIFTSSGLLPFFVSFVPKTPQYPGVRRVILISIDSCNPEYLNPYFIPNLYNRILRDGIIFKTALSVLASETQSGHTSMLTGSYPNSTGVVSNGLYFPFDWTDPDTGEVIRAGTLIPTITNQNLVLTNTTFEQFMNNASMKTGFIAGKSRLPPLLSRGSDLIFGFNQADNTINIQPAAYLPWVGAPFTYLAEDSVDIWSMNCLIEVVKHDPDTDFIFLNLAFLDDLQHCYGAGNEAIYAQLRELDNLFLRLFNELEARGEYDSTFFAVTADHGQDRCDYVVKLHEIFQYSSNPHIEATLMSDGQAAFVFLDDQAQLSDAINLLEATPGIAMVVPRNNTGLPGYANYSSINMPFDRNRSGDIFVCTEEHGTTVINPMIPFALYGIHGGVSCQDVPMAFFCKNIEFNRTLKGYEIINHVPNTVDIMPTIASYMNWSLANMTLDGQVLDIFE